MKKNNFTSHFQTYTSFDPIMLIYFIIHSQYYYYFLPGCFRALIFDFVRKTMRSGWELFMYGLYEPVVSGACSCSVSILSILFYSLISGFLGWSFIIFSIFIEYALKFKYKKIIRN